jgi:hypothetical protein
MGIHLSTYIGPYIQALDPKMKTKEIWKGKKCQGCDRNVGAAGVFCSLCGNKLIDVYDQIDAIDYNDLVKDFDTELGERLCDVSYFMNEGSKRTPVYTANIAYGSKFGHRIEASATINLGDIDAEKEIALFKKKFSTEIAFISTVFQKLEINFGIIQYWS